MKTKNLLLLVILMTVITGLVSAQSTFQKTYGGHEKDALFKLAKTSDGGYVCAGETESFGSLPRDIYLFKIDANGVHLWSVVYGGIGSDYATDVIKTSDNGFLIIGGTTSFGSGSDDALLIKTDANGVPQWSKVYGGTQQEYFLSATQTNDGGYIAVGTTLSFGAGSNDMLIVKTNAAGDTLWTRIMGGTLFEEAARAIQTSDNNYTICGRSNSFTAANTDAVLMKLNPNGDTVWTVQYGNFGAEEAITLSQTSDGGYIVFGNTTSFGNDYEPYLNRFNSSGNLLWSKLYSGPKSDAIYDGIITSDSGFAMCGFTESFGEGHDRGSDSANYYVIRTNMNGDTLWTHTYGGDKVDEAFSVLEANDGGFLIFGFSGSFGTDSLEGYLVKTDTLGNSGCNEKPSNPQVVTPTTLVGGFPAQISSGMSVANAPFIALNPPTHENILCLYDAVAKTETEKESCVVFPNPFTNQTTIKFSKKINGGILYLYDMLGELVLEKSNITGNETVLNIGTLPGGVYIFKIIEKEKEIYNGKAVVY